MRSEVVEEFVGDLPYPFGREAIKFFEASEYAAVVLADDHREHIAEVHRHIYRTVRVEVSEEPAVLGIVEAERIFHGGIVAVVVKVPFPEVTIELLAPVDTGRHRQYRSFHVCEL